MDIQEINIIGAGSLGSFTTQLISKMNLTFNCPIFVWDFDNVEEHNIQNQIYTRNEIGAPKVGALASIVSQLSNSGIRAINEKVLPETDLRGLVIVAVDNMEARKYIFKTCQFNWGIDYLIEARMGGHLARVLGLDARHPDAVTSYEQSLYDDNQAANPICATNETLPALWMAASAIAQLALIYKKTPYLKHNFVDLTINLSAHPIVNSRACALI